MPADLAKSFAAVAVCGCGHEGRLGWGSTTSTDTITLLTDFLPSGAKATAGLSSAPCGEVLSIHCGGYHTIVTTTSGVYGWGMNDCGQLGLGRAPATDAEGTFFMRPTRLKFFDRMSWDSMRGGRSEEEEGGVERKSTEAQERMVQIACGALHSMVLTDRALYACGRNEFGQLGLGHDEESVCEWTQVCSFGSSEASAYCSGGNRDNSMNLILPFGKNSSVISGIVTHVSCGTHHTLLAWRDVVLEQPSGSVEANEVDCASAMRRVQNHDDDALSGYFYYPTLIMATGKGDYGELGYDTDLHATLRSRDKRVQDTLLREAIARQEQLQVGGAHGEPWNLDAWESGHPELTHMQKTMSSKNPCEGWLRKQQQQRRQRRPEFYSTKFQAVHFALLERCAMALTTERLLQESVISSVNAFHEGKTGNRLSGEGVPSDFWEVVQLQAMHLHSGVTLRKCNTLTEARDRSTNTQYCGAGDVQTYHWGCYFCGEIEGSETSVPRLLDGKAGSTIHAGSEILLRHRLWGPMGSLCTIEKCDSVEDPSRGHSSACEEVFVRGQGKLGLGADDSFQKDWAQIPGTAHLAARIVGRTHFLMLLRNGGSASCVTDSGDTFVLGFGDNLNGQIGRAYDFQSIKAGAQSRHSGSGAGEESVEVLSPRHVLKVGDILLAAPSTPPIQPKGDRLLRGHNNMVQSEYENSEPLVWVVDRVIDVGAGVRHSVFLVNVHSESKG